MLHRITQLADIGIGELRLFSVDRASFSDYCLPPPPPLKGAWQINITGVLHCQHRRDAGAIRQTPLWSLLPNFLLSNLYAAFSSVIPMLILNCFGGLPAAAVGSPVLFLAPTLLLVQVLACYHS